MTIDENKEVFDLSDHNLIKVGICIKNMTNGFKGNDYEETEYYKLDEDSLGNDTKALENEIAESTQDINISKLNNMIKDTADTCLKAVYRRKKGKDSTKIEPPWINEDIRRAIKVRKAFNRQKRNASNEVDKEQAKRQYQNQKEVVQGMIKAKITEHEEKKLKELTEAGNIGKCLWKYIKFLKNINQHNHKQDLKLYDEAGFELSAIDAKQALIDFWTKIYQQYENNIEEVWNEEQEKAYIETLAKDDNNMKEGDWSKLTLTTTTNNGKQIINFQKVNELIKFHRNLHEHMEMAVQVKSKCNKMEKPNIKKDEIVKVLQKLKSKKSAGPDGLKPELYKTLKNSEVCLNTLEQCFNKVLEGNVPNEWKVSKTVMIPKVSKPQAKQLRPIALTDVSYKIFMTLIKNSVERHIKANDLGKETQSGFTDGGRTENNIFILKYCIEKSKQMKKPFIVTSVDYRKAYDSIRRSKMVESFKEKKLHEDVISTVSEIYKGDRTVINYGDIGNIEIDISSGIRQGCTGSTTFFKLITYKIIERMEKEQGFTDEFFRLAALYFADDGLILANSIEDAKRNIEVLTEISRECGLEINRDKSNTIIFGMRNRPENISGIQVVNEIKYLGITINSGKDCFKRQKEIMIEKASRLANQTYPIISKSCNKVMIGKTYWKSVALPSILHGHNVVEFSKSDILKLQQIENKVYRHILGAPSYAQVSALRGEIGASSMTARIMEGKIKLLKHTMKNEESLLGKITTEMKALPSAKWTRNMGLYLKRVNIDYNQLRYLSKDEIKSAVSQWDTKEWLKELREKPSLEIYCRWKEKMGKMDKIYDNTPLSVLLYKARSNILPLNDRKRWSNGDTSCKACGAVMEDLNHFLLYCPKYNEIRSTIIQLQQPYQRIEQDIIGRYLFRGDMEDCKKSLGRMWNKRQFFEKQAS